jgi:exonuclease III
VPKQAKYVKIGTHNTRGWGSRWSTLDQGLKTRCLLRLWEWRKWDIVLLSEVSLGAQGILEIERTLGNWYVIHRDRVAIALNEEMKARWDKGGNKVMVGEDGRSMAVYIPKQGKCPGLSVTAVYAPQGRRRVHQGKRQKFYECLASCDFVKSNKTLKILGGIGTRH